MLNKIKKADGFTLIEILASFVLLTIVISLFLSTFPQMANMNNRNEENLDAANVGKELLVEMKKLTFTQALTEPTSLPITLLQNINKSEDPIIISGTYTSHKQSFKVKITILPIPDINGAQTLYRMQIDVMNVNDRVLTTTYGYLKK